MLGRKGKGKATITATPEDQAYKIEQKWVNGKLQLNLVKNPSKIKAKCVITVK